MTQPPYGNYPPPPAGGFGDYQPNIGPSLNVGDALNFGWARFKDNALPWIGIVVLTMLASSVFSFLGGSGSFTTVALDTRYVLFSLLTIVIGWIFQAAMVRGALDEVDGRKPSFGDFFQLPNMAMILLTGLLLSVGTAIGFVLLIIPGFIFLFLSYFAVQFVVDQRVSPVDAIKSSMSVISKNVGPLLLLALAVIGLNLVGALLCGLGLLVSVPVTSIAVSYAYRTVTGNHPYRA